MPPTIESPCEEQSTLAQDIWDNVPPNSPLQFSDVQMRELDRRIAEDDADPDGGIPWEVVQARLKAKHGI